MLSDFKRPSFEEIKNEIDNDLRNVFGQDINLTPDSVLGQLSGVFSYRMNDLFQQVELAYNNAFPQTAVGRALDRFADLTGVVRAGASRLDVNLFVWTPDGKVPALGDTVFCNGSPYTVVDVRPGSLSSAQMVSFNLPINRSSISVDGVTILVTSDTSGIVIGHRELEDRGMRFKRPGGNLLVMYGRPDQIIDISRLDSTANRYVYHTITVTGEVSVKADQKWTAPSSWGNIVSIEQPFESFGGKPSESDDSYRARILLPRSTSGLGTIETMRNYMYGIPGVVYCDIEENASGMPDDRGMPPNSIRFILSGNYSDDDIVKAILYCKPAGISTVGAFRHLGVSWDIASSSANSLVVTIESWMPDDASHSRPEKQDIDKEVRKFLASLDGGQDVSPARIAAHITYIFTAVNVCTVTINGSSDVIDRSGITKFVVESIYVNLPGD